MRESLRWVGQTNQYGIEAMDKFEQRSKDEDDQQVIQMAGVMGIKIDG